jgi:hypothetical protein
LGGRRPKTSRARSSKSTNDGVLTDRQANGSTIGLSGMEWSSGNGVLKFCRHISPAFIMRG